MMPNDISTLEFREVGSLPAFDAIGDGELFAISLSNNTATFTHGLHRFPAKYIPQIPAWALDSFGTRDTVCLDPFMGSGTMLVESVLRGGTGIGVDIDPLARFIARAKVTPVDHERIRALGADIDGRWAAAAEPRAPMPDIGNFEHWFAPPQWAKLQGLHDTILGLPASPAEQDFLLTVFSSCLRWVSNADNQSQKTYVSGTLPKTPPPCEEVFWRFLDRAATGLADLNRKRHSEAAVVIPDDADATRLGLADDSVDLAVTSPPYVDSVDYPYNMMLEYFWLGPRLGVDDRKAFNRLRRAPIGAKNPDAAADLPGAVRDVVDLDRVGSGRRAAVAQYFSLMGRHFDEMARCMKDGARYVFVVGNSQTRSNPLPVHEALIRQAAESGLVLERSFGYRVRRHYMKFPRAGRGGIILVDWVLVLRKQAGATAVQPRRLPWVTLPPGSVAH
jgi:hypothetical protein